MSANRITGILGGERRAIARAISEVENETAEGNAILRGVHPHLGKARVLGITGPPGAGKSTLINALIGELRKRDQKVGVVAVDPSSPLSGGAILGDRIRMGDHAGDDGVFIRSLASRGHLGGLSRTAARVVDVLDAAGVDMIVVETVGAGQSEVEIHDLADTRLVICPPGLGDDVQAIKAGILEIADIFVVNKSDSPLAERTEQEIKGMLALRKRTGWVPPVIRTIATTGEGVAGLVDAVAQHATAVAGHTRMNGARGRMRRILAQAAAENLRDRIVQMESAELDALCIALHRGELDYREAAEKAIGLAGRAHD